jgi:hypothetical protein
MSEQERLIRKALRVTIREAERLVGELRRLEAEAFYDGIPLGGRSMDEAHNAIHRVTRELMVLEERLSATGEVTE